MSFLIFMHLSVHFHRCLGRIALRLDPKPPQRTFKTSGVLYHHGKSLTLSRELKAHTA